ncbi:MAG TPA: HlyC/CorC family transporter [Xanthobacteraceae bacterium]|nr:HlyC/CorC family transporter [Xanthobacteraceae bacterium]
MLFEDWLSFAAILVCLFFSFFYSASETSLTAVSRARLLRLEKAGNKGARLVSSLLEIRERMIGAILTGNNVVNIAATALTTGLLLSWFGDVGALYATGIMTVVVVVFTEVLPKTLAINAPERTALLVARPIFWTVRLFGPLLIGIEGIVRFILRMFGVKMGTDQAFLSAHEELRGQVDLLHQEGSVEKQDRDMFGGLLDLRDLVVSDVMIHRTKMITACADDPSAEVVKEVLESPVTRVPLWSERPENIIGILHAKDLLRALQGAGGDPTAIDVKTIARPPWFVPDIRPLSEQLKAFRRRKTPFALVVDEYGEVMGLVTLEDILEEIVGDITDEHDIVVPGVRPLPDGSVNVDGGVPIRDLNRAMEWSLPDDEATTIAGLVIHEARSIPEPGQSFTFHGFRFNVLRRERNRITALRITPVMRKPAKAA